MPEWAWLLLATVLPALAFVVGRLLRLRALTVEGIRSEGNPDRGAATAASGLGSRELVLAEQQPALALRSQRNRILVVDDDAPLRLLLRTTLAADEFEVEEAVSAEEAAELARVWRPSVVILDIGLPGMSGLTFCRELKQQQAFGSPTVILLSGLDTTTVELAQAGADAILHKPFSPLQLVTLLDQLGQPDSTIDADPDRADADQLLLYARDLNQLLGIERAHRRLLQQAYRQTVTVLADALEAKDPLTGLHALRVQRYALELTDGFDRSLLDDPSLEYGFLLHDIGKIAIPDQILSKQGPLTDTELEIVRQHPTIGAQLLSGIALLSGEGLNVVRHHHERWDGCGYPDRLTAQQIPIGARIFALADTLDAMTTDRPYRHALSWEQAIDEILAQDGRQFDPRVVSAFAIREQRLHRTHTELTTHSLASRSRVDA
jgi:putative two-component system response regulator